MATTFELIQKELIVTNSDSNNETLIKCVSKSIIERFQNKQIRRVMLVTPPDADISFFDINYARRKRYANYPPYGILLLARRLLDAGLNVELVNLQHEVLKAAYRSSNNDFDYDSVWREKLNEKIGVFNPDFVGVTCMFTMTHESFKKICFEIAKKNLPLAVGGVHVSNDVTRIKKEIPQIDYIFVREADNNFPQFIEAVNSKKINETSFGGVVARYDENKWFSFDSYSIPTENEISQMPAYELIEDLEDYSKYGMIGSFYWFKGEDTKAGTILSNRGCRAQCSFCSVRNFNGKGVRRRHIESVVDELDYLKNERGLSHFMFLDDDLFKDEKQTIALFDEIVRRQLEITWDATNGVIAYACTPEVIHAAYESGCIGINLGMESGNPEILKKIRKPGTVKNFIKAAETCRQYQEIVTSVFLIVGFPNENMSKILDTIEVAKEMDLDWCRTQVLQPLPNTPIYQEMVDAGLISDDEQKGRFTVGSYGRARNEDDDRRFRDHDPKKAFEDISLDAIPSKQQLSDIWFYMDFHLNYKRLFNENRDIKLVQQKKMLERIANVNSVNNGFALYFLAVIYKKQNLLVPKSIKQRLQKVYDDDSYWASKLEQFGLSIFDFD